MNTDHYRDDLTAAVLRIEQLEHELALYRADPAHERVDIAEEKLGRARSRRHRAQYLLPRVLIASFATMGAFALTDPTFPPAVRTLGYIVSALGAVATLVIMTSVLTLSAQGPRPAKLVELERQLRIAKGDVGVRQGTWLRIEDAAKDQRDDAALSDAQSSDEASTRAAVG